MKYSHDGLIYSYVLLPLQLSCWYYLTVRLPKWNFLFFEFEEIWGGFLENLHFLRRLEEIWENSNLRRSEEIWGGVATLHNLSTSHIIYLILCRFEPSLPLLSPTPLFTFSLNPPHLTTFFDSIAPMKYRINTKKIMRETYLSVFRRLQTTLNNFSVRNTFV